MASKAFGQRLKISRVVAGYTTARAFARALGISENNYARYERGGATPNHELINRICDLLRITPTELVRADAPVNPTIGAASKRQRAQSAADTLSGLGTVSPPSNRVGFSENEQRPIAAALRPSVAENAANGTARTVNTDVRLRFEMECWNLAMMLAAIAQRKAKNRKSSSGELALHRAAAQIFIELQATPFSTIAHHLSTIETSRIDRAAAKRLEQAIGTLIGHFAGGGTFTE